MPSESDGQSRFSTVLYFPAPGYRERANGALVYVGSNGDSWSSTVSGTYGMYLGFNVTWFSPSHSFGRGYGFLLRCLSE